MVDKCSIKLGPTRTHKSTRKKYVLCDIILPGMEWAAVDDADMKALPSLAKRGRRSIVADVHETTTKKGVKRKLVQLDDGSVYKLRKNKAGDTGVLPGHRI